MKEVTDTLAYGEELTAPYEDQNDKVLNTITYTGHEKDYETNLTYMMARYYSQGYGRFLSPDPGYDYDQLDPMSWNLYAYVRGNPVNAMDNNGEMVIYLNNGLCTTGNFRIEFQDWNYYFQKPAFWINLGIGLGKFFNFLKIGDYMEAAWEAAKAVYDVSSEVNTSLNAIYTDFTEVSSFITFGDVIAFETGLKDYVSQHLFQNTPQYQQDLIISQGGINEKKLTKLLSLILEYIKQQQEEGKISKDEAEELAKAYSKQIKEAKLQMDMDKKLHSQFVTHQDEWDLIFLRVRSGV